VFTGRNGTASLSSRYAREALRIVTTDLLSVWTDPDTAMHAVGSSLGIFDDPMSDSGVVLATESPLRDALLNVLLQLVDDGELEKRACLDGRYAFRWREDAAPTAVSTDAVSARLDAYFASMPREVPLRVAQAAAPVVGEVPAVRARYWPRTVAIAAPLAVPALSCFVALATYVMLGHAIGVGVVVALGLLGVVGLVRRVPLAGFWTTGLVVAALLMRLS
jgi:hypothetical protein